MLTHLHIENYALIRHLDICFEAGFTVITGQTGAGKSILLGALGLLQGNRADTKAIMAGARKCIVEADFVVPDARIARLMDEIELDFDGDNVTVRREIADSGKTRAFVNDTPVPLIFLRQLASYLIDIHSQHQNLLLQQADFQLNVLDALHGKHTLLTDYASLYKEWMQTRKFLEETIQAQRASQTDQDYLSYLYNQLDAARLQPDEQEFLEQEQQMLEHAEDIKSALYQVSGILAEEEQGAIDRLRRSQRQLANLSRIYPICDELASRIDSCYIELRDIDDTLQDCLLEVDYDPGRMQQVNDRLSLIYELEQKHHVNSVAELLQIRDEMGKKLQQIENYDQIISEQEARIRELESRLSALADSLHDERKQASLALESQIIELLRPMGMPNIRFKVEMQSLSSFLSTGIDEVQFLFSANQGTPLQPIQQIASGGEIARLMLAIKSILARHTSMPTIVFDEIDTGVSGSIAQCMAHTMMQMSADPRRQVISITHLPQIAGMGQHHFCVYKEDSEDITLSHIRQLTQDERVEEIAHMLSGANLSQAALDNARQLINLQFSMDK